MCVYTEPSICLSTAVSVYLVPGWSFDAFAFKYGRFLKNSKQTHDLDMNAASIIQHVAFGQRIIIVRGIFNSVCHFLFGWIAYLVSFQNQLKVFQ